MKVLFKSLAAVVGLQTRPAIKILIICALFCTLANFAHSQSRQTQAILDSWDREIIAEIFADTITSEIQYSDTVDIGRWAGSPQHFALFVQLDSVAGKTHDIDLTATFELAVENAGHFYIHADGTGSAVPQIPPLSSTGNYVFNLVPYGGNYIRFAFSCSDTLSLHATLWMKH